MLSGNAVIWFLRLLILFIIGYTQSASSEFNNNSRSSTTTPSASSSSSYSSTLSSISVSSSTSTNSIPTTTTILSTSITLSPLSIQLPSTSNSTCRFRTANYITHGLPQQCLKISKPTLSSAADVLYGPNSTETNISASTTSVPSNVESSQTNFNKEIPITLGAENWPTASEEPAQSFDTAPKEDAESPLDNSKFLSFEEWKAQNLAQAGQSAEDFGERAAREPRRRPAGMNSALDALGEDAEIELVFGGESEKTEEEADAVSVTRGSGQKPSETVNPQSHVRSKDAGKTCKERFNFASFDCAATVHKTNKECKGATAVLVENKDSYMLNKCGASNKFVIIELCDDILVDTIVLANYEFFSSMVRTFRISVSDRYPVKSSGWKSLGTFEAKNSREIQAFLVENPLIWARYLRIEFLTHYGNEFYCPVSLLRIHGTTMMEEFRAQEELARGESDDDREEVVPEAVASGVDTASFKMRGEGDEEYDEEPPKASEFASPTKIWVHVGKNKSSVVDAVVPAPSISICERRDLQQVASLFYTRDLFCLPVHTPTAYPSSKTQSSTNCSAKERTKEPFSVAPSRTKVQSVESKATASSISKVETGKKVDNPSNSTISQPVRNTSSQQQQQQQTIKIAPSRATNSTEPKQQASPSAASPPAIPTTQESFFKTIHKRLQLLETNATLSLKYIEEQSKLLRDAFGMMEKRQLNRTNSYITELNMTVFNELRGFRQQYDQLWQSTVIALESHKEMSQHEIIAISQRLTMLADEVIFQKRMSIIQSVLLLVTIALVIFSKTNHFDTPLLQTMFSSRSHIRLPLASPATSPPPPLIRRFMYGHSRNPSSDYEDHNDDFEGRRTEHPMYNYDNSPSSPRDYLAVDGMMTPHATQSSPATPSGRSSTMKRSLSWNANYNASDVLHEYDDEEELEYEQGEEDDEIHGHHHHHNHHHRQHRHTGIWNKMEYHEDTESNYHEADEHLYEVEKIRQRNGLITPVSSVDGKRSLEGNGSLKVTIDPFEHEISDGGEDILDIN